MFSMMLDPLRCLIFCLIFNILISTVDLMAEDCVFKCVLGKCPVKQKLSRSQPDGARLRNIIDASIQYGASLHVDLQEQLDADALNVIVKAIKAEVVAIEYEQNTYTRNICMSIASESVSGTIQLLLQKLSPSLGAESLT